MSRSPRVTILLPPSEGKAPGGNGGPWSPNSGVFGATPIGDARHEVVAAMAKANGGDEKLLGVGGAHLKRAQEANRSLLTATTLPAASRYTGVVHDHIDLASLPAQARRRAAASILVLSGLLGVVAIDDPTPDYRIKMGARLGELGTLSRWWRPRLSPVLDDTLDRRIVIDLLPNEHRAAWEPTPSRFTALLRIGFVEGNGAKAGKAGGHDAKAAKGLLVRHLLVSGGDPRDALASFAHPRFDVTVEAS